LRAYELHVADERLVRVTNKLGEVEQQWYAAGARGNLWVLREFIRDGSLDYSTVEFRKWHADWVQGLRERVDLAEPDSTPHLE
jgi:hypothetical protein